MTNDLQKEDILHALCNEERGDPCVNCGVTTWWRDTDEHDRYYHNGVDDILLDSTKRPPLFLAFRVGLDTRATTYPPPLFQSRAWPLCDEDCAEYAYREIMRLCDPVFAIHYDVCELTIGGSVMSWRRTRAWVQELYDRAMLAMPTVRRL